MRLVFVHGINQQARSEDAIKQEWLGALQANVQRGERWPEPVVSDIRAPFYGDRLFALTETMRDVAAVAQGAADVPDDFAAFAGPALEQMAMRIAPEAMADAELEPVAQGAGVHKRSIKALARILERVSPLHGSIALQLLGQAHAYIKRPHIAEEIDAIVRPVFDSDEPTIVVAHSLGTIVAYKLLRAMSERAEGPPCPLFMTLGSPLGIAVVRKSFPLPRGRPAIVARWFNGADPADFVALQPVLDQGTFGTGIEDIDGIRNDDADPHAIADYLAYPRVGAIVAAAMAGAL